MAESKNLSIFIILAALSKSQKTLPIRIELNVSLSFQPHLKLLPLFFICHFLAQMKCDLILVVIIIS